jgi:hypothetical protein
MARGWESKSVEAQILTAETAQTRHEGLSEMEKKREGLLLSRIRVSHDLAAAQNPRHRRILEQALAHLDQELTSLK